VLPFVIGTVVVGDPTTLHTPLSGHKCPVLAVVPIGAIILNISYLPLFIRDGNK